MANEKPPPKKLDPLSAAAVAPPPEEGKEGESPASAAPAARRGTPLADLKLPEKTRPTGHEEPTLPPAGAMPTPKRAAAYVVEETHQASWGSRMIRLAKGDRVSEETHGDGAVARLRGLGFKLSEA